MATPPAEKAGPEKIDIREVSEWRTPPHVGFDQKASLEIAKWVLTIFAGVYVLCFVVMIAMLGWKDATFKDASDLLKFMLNAVLPLVTLAVGYYLGDRSRQARN